MNLFITVHLKMIQFSAKPSSTKTVSKSYLWLALYYVSLFL